MQREIQLTADGSHTIVLTDRNISYHSKHGAVAESMHVFIEAGLLPLLSIAGQQPLAVLEIGLGTGLNALLTMREAIHNKRIISYTGIELFPVTASDAGMLNYGERLFMQEAFRKIHLSEWEQPVPLDDYFTLEKKQMSVHDLVLTGSFHCIYFDAFAPTEQPEMWTEAVFQKLYNHLHPGGVLVTYSSKTTVRNAMKQAGFIIRKIPGPYGKREMVRAEKAIHI